MSKIWVFLSSVFALLVGAFFMEKEKDNELRKATEKFKADDAALKKEQDVNNRIIADEQAKINNLNTTHRTEVVSDSPTVETDYWNKKK